MECRDDIASLHALRVQIDRELLDLSFLSDAESMGQRELAKSSSAPDLRNLPVTVRDMETSSVCLVDDLSQGSLGAELFLGASTSACDVKRSKEWLDAYL